MRRIRPVKAEGPKAPERSGAAAQAPKGPSARTANPGREARRAEQRRPKAGAMQAGEAAAGGRFARDR